MAAARKRSFNEILDVLQYDIDSSSSSSDSSDDDIDFLLLELGFARKKELGKHLHIDDISEEECEHMFRFQKDDMKRLYAALAIPESYTCPQGTVATGMEALMILLRRLTYPNRWCDLVPLFGRAEPELSQIFNTIADDIYDRFSNLLSTLNLTWFDPQLFANVIHRKGAPLTQCWGFIDGTVRPIARPVRNQRIMFSGHKRVHCLKFQSVVAPNGLIAHMYVPVEGRLHDAFMLGDSGLSPLLQQLLSPVGSLYFVWGLCLWFYPKYSGLILRSKSDCS